jgi:hypothetical protein
MLLLVLGSMLAASVQTDEAPAAASAPPYEVTITHGKRVNAAKMQSVVRVIEASGCPVVVVEDATSRNITVETNGESATFRDGMKAADWAMARCQ